jgi:hypothetical protein
MGGLNHDEAFSFFIADSLTTIFSSVRALDICSVVAF